MLYYSLDDGAAHPRQAYKYDAGIDLALKHDLTVPVGAHRVGDTGVRVAVPRGHETQMNFWYVPTFAMTGL